MYSTAVRRFIDIDGGMHDGHFVGICRAIDAHLYQSSSCCTVQCTMPVVPQRNSREGKYGLYARRPAGRRAPPSRAAASTRCSASYFPSIRYVGTRYDCCNDIIKHTRCVTCHRTTADILKAVLVGMVNDRPRPPWTEKWPPTNPLLPRDKRYRAVFECLRFRATTLTADGQIKRNKRNITLRIHRDIITA